MDSVIVTKNSILRKILALYFVIEIAKIANILACTITTYVYDSDLYLRTKPVNMLVGW